MVSKGFRDTGVCPFKVSVELVLVGERTLGEAKVLGAPSISSGHHCRTRLESL